MKELTQAETAALLADELGHIAALLDAKLLEVRARYQADLASRVAALSQLPEQLGQRIDAAASFLEDLERRLSVLEAQGRVNPPPVVQKLAAHSPEEDRSVAGILRAAGLEVIDRRSKAGGSLWVTGPEARVVPVLRKLQEQGIKFTRAGKATATGGKPGWYSKTKR